MATEPLPIDDNRAIVGAPFENGNVGAMYAFVKDGDSWEFHSRLEAGEEEDTGNDRFGMACDINADRVVVGLHFMIQMIMTTLVFPSSTEFVMTFPGLWKARCILTGTLHAMGTSLAKSSEGPSQSTPTRLPSVLLQETADAPTFLVVTFLVKVMKGPGLK